MTQVTRAAARLSDQSRAAQAVWQGHGQAKHVRPVVVTGGIEALPLLGEARRIELGVEDSLLVVERAGEIRAVGTEDRAASPAEDVAPLELVEKREVRRIRARPAGSGTARSRMPSTRGRCGRASPARHRRRRPSRRCRARRPTRRARSARAACSSPSRSGRRSARSASRARAARARRPGPRSGARGSSARASCGGARARLRASGREASCRSCPDGRDRPR